ncbi:MAG TPA: hypothetical protein VLC46_01000 [Thermoanaerobaculia bacterium]|jgi:hypothetical protein|nr:hypothetical protein [Thermoanaerobaculia bacterium]
MNRSLRIAIFSAMAIVIVALSISNVVLRRRVDAALHSAASHQQRFRVGEMLPEFSVMDRYNHVTRIGGASADERVFVFFLPGCNPCEEALAAVAAKPYKNTVVVSVLSPQLSAADEANLPAAVSAYSVDDFAQSPINSRAHTVPQIVRVSTRGSIVAVCATYASCGPKS